MSTLKVTNIQHGSATNVAMVLDTAGTVKAYSTISVGNVTPSSSGAGITFPATQSASSDANTLDDYEEGTWTPVLKEGANTLTVATSYGVYTKVGRLVTITFDLENITKSGSGDLTITGVPFNAVSTGTNGGFIGAVRYNRFTVPANSYQMAVELSTNTIYVWWLRTGDIGSLQTTASDMANTSSNNDLYGTISYIV